MSDLFANLQKKKYFRKNDGATPKQIEDAERNLELKFSDEYIEYLSEFGVVSFYGHELTGICNVPRLNVVDITIKQKEYNTNIPMYLYVVEEAHIDGIVIWQSETGEIFQSAPNSKLIKLCNSLSEYIELY